MSNGKGDTRRPKQISDAEMELRWYMAFGGYTIPDDVPCVVSDFGTLESKADMESARDC